MMEGPSNLVLHHLSSIFPFLLMRKAGGIYILHLSSILVCSVKWVGLQSLLLAANVPVAKWITRLPPKEKIAGSIPARDAFDEV
jgi:hypothetical protein